MPQGLDPRRTAGPGEPALNPLRPGRNASELLEEAEPVQLDPVLYQLSAGEAADDDDGPRHIAARRRDPLPFALLGRPPTAAPDAPIAGEEHVARNVGGVRKGVRNLLMVPGTERSGWCGDQLRKLPNDS